MPWPRHRAEAETGRDLGGAPAIRGPEHAYYQLLTGEYSKVSSTGKLILTATQLSFDSAIGTDVAVPLQDVVEVRDQGIRRFHVGGHDTQLVIATRSGEIGFLVADTAAWAAGVRVQLPPASESERISRGSSTDPIDADGGQPVHAHAVRECSGSAGSRF